MISHKIIEIDVEYTGGFSHPLNQEIEAICGRRTSAGFDFTGGTRDMQFRIREYRLKSIRAKLRKYKNVTVSVISS